MFGRQIICLAALLAGASAQEDFEFRSFGEPMCPSGSELTQSECEPAAIALNLDYDEQYHYGHWDHIPCGCSLMFEQGSSIVKKLMWNMHTVTCQDNERTIGSICKASNSTPPALTTPESESPQGSIDIGTVGFTGGSVEGATAGDWQVSGSGSDIWSSYDHFHYMYFDATGDLTVTCKVNSFTGSTNSWRKGGIMFRADTGQRSPHSHLQLTGWGVAQQSRQGLNWGSISYHDSYDTSNVWLRLVKQGDSLTSYIKRDGDFGFMQYNTVEVALPTNYKVGIAVTSHDNNQLATLDISNLEFSNEVFTMGASSTVEIGETGNKLWFQQVTEDLVAMDAAGAGIGGTADAFGFFGQEQTGDITATTFVSRLTRRNNYSKGGLMIRTSHDVDAPHVSVLVNSGTGVTLYCRQTKGGETLSKNKGVMLEDVELRLEKTGNSVKALYRKVGAPTWYELGLETTIDFDTAGTYYVGHAVTSSQHGSHSKLIAAPVDITSA